MFCPKCGCLLPDDATTCSECGYRIRKNIRKDLKQEQPPDKKFIREKNTKFANGREIRLIIGIAACILVVASLLLKWASPDYTGLNLIIDRPLGGGGAWFLCSVPALSALFAAVAGCLMYFDVHKQLIFPLGILTAAVSLVFCIQIQAYADLGAGLGSYISTICGLIIIRIGLSRHITR